MQNQLKICTCQKLRFRTKVLQIKKEKHFYPKKNQARESKDLLQHSLIQFCKKIIFKINKIITMKVSMKTVYLIILKLTEVLLKINLDHT